MKVLFSSPFLSYHGHIKRIGALKAKSMAEAGLDVTVIGFPLTYDLLTQGERLRYISVQQGLSAVARARIERWSRRLGNVWLFIVETCWVQLSSIRYAQWHGFNLVFIADVEPWLMIPALLSTGALWRGPKVVCFYSFLFEYNLSFRHQHWFAWIRSWFNIWSARWLPRWVDVVSGCINTVQPYMRIRSDRVHIVPDGFICDEKVRYTLEQARYAQGISKDRRILLHFGIANPGKGTDYLLEALRGIRSDFELYIVGTSSIYSREGMETNIPAEWREHVHIENRYVTEDERIRYFAACDAMILPYRYGFRGASGNFRDAISFGKAVIASDQFLMGEMVRKYDLGILFKPDDVDDLRRALVEFTQKPEAWFQGIAERSQAVVEEFSWDKVGLRYRELFERLTAAGKGEARGA